MTVEKRISILLLRPITAGEDNVMDQSEFLAITCNLFKAQEKSSVSIAIAELFSTVIWKLLCNELWSEAQGWPDRPR